MSDELLVPVATVTPTITAGAYSAGDALGGLLTFSNLVMGTTGNRRAGGILDSVTIVDLSNQAADIDLVLFNQTFTATTDNAAFAPSDGDLANVIGVIQLAGSDYSQFDDNAVATRHGLGLPLKSADANGDIFGQMVVRGTPTFADTDELTIKLGVLRG